MTTRYQSATETIRRIQQEARAQAVLDALRAFAAKRVQA